MKILFVHGSNAIKEDEEGNLYADGSYSDEVWSRYYELSKNLTVMTRKESKIYTKEEAQRRFHSFNKEKYQFVEYTSDDVMEEEVKKADALVIRVPSRVSNKAINFAKKYQKKYLIEVVGCTFDLYWNQKGFKSKIDAIQLYTELRRYIKEAKLVLYVSSEFLQRRYPTKGESIACSDVVLEKQNESVLAERIQKIEAKKETDSISLCTVGTVDLKIKGQRYVIEAIAKLNQMGKQHYQYVIVGGGDDTKLRDLAKSLGVENDVTFTGMQPHDKVFEYMKESDIYVQPSETEGLPRVMVEAISVAVPCIGSDVGGIPELINQSYTFRSKNVASLVETIQKMTKEKLIEQAKANFEKSKEFQYEVLEKKRKEFYQKLVK